MLGASGCYCFIPSTVFVQLEKGGNDLVQKSFAQSSRTGWGRGCKHRSSLYCVFIIVFSCEQLCTYFHPPCI